MSFSSRSFIFQSLDRCYFFQKSPLDCVVSFHKRAHRIVLFLSTICRWTHIPLRNSAVKMQSSIRCNHQNSAIRTRRLHHYHKSHHSTLLCKISGRMLCSPSQIANH